MWKQAAGTHVHKTGHLGFALLCWAPIAWQLVADGAAGLALAGGIVCVGLTQLPDVDLSISLLRHRGPTHSITFALAVGFVSARAFGFVESQVVAATSVTSPSIALDPAAPVAPLVPASTVAAVGGLAGTLAILAHVIADSLTRAGVEPLWPINRSRYSLDLVNADNWFANKGALSMGSVGVVTAILFGAGWGHVLVRAGSEVLSFLASLPYL